MPQDEQTRWLNDALAGVKRSAFFMGKAMVRAFFFYFNAFFLCFSFAERRSVLASRIPIQWDSISESSSLVKRQKKREDMRERR